MYKALIRSVVVYGSECWVLTENIKQKLLVFERKILRRIFGPTQKASRQWRLKTNEELEKAFNNENIARYIKYKPYAIRLKGRPRVMWEDDVRNDLRKMGVTNRKQRTQERNHWKEIIQQAKTHKEL